MLPPPNAASFPSSSGAVDVPARGSEAPPPTEEATAAADASRCCDLLSSSPSARHRQRSSKWAREAPNA